MTQNPGTTGKTMDPQQRRQAARQLRGLADDLESGRVRWLAISVLYASGYRLTYHTADAPRRPGGLT